MRLDVLLLNKFRVGVWVAVKWRIWVSEPEYQRVESNANKSIFAAGVVTVRSRFLCKNVFAYRLRHPESAYHNNKKRSKPSLSSWHLYITLCVTSPWILITFFSSDQLRSVCVPVGANVTVPCPVSDNSESSFNLFHADERIYNHTCSHCHAGVELHTENKSASFKLIGVNSSSSGIYRCEGTVMYPPPLIKRNKRTLVLIEGKVLL